MPRAKVQAKQTSSGLSTNGNDVTPTNEKEQNNEVDVAAKQPAKSKARGKKTAAVAAGGDKNNDEQAIETVVAKKGKRKQVNIKPVDETNEEQTKLPEMNGNEASTSSGSEGAKGSNTLGKKTAARAEANGVQEQQIVVSKKTTKRGKRENIEIEQVTVPAKRTSRKPTTESSEAQEPETTKTTKSRAKKEAAPVEVEPVAAEPAKRKGRSRKPTTESTEDSVQETVKSSKTRAKKDPTLDSVEPIVKKGRSKKDKEEVITQLTEKEPAKAPKGRTKKNTEEKDVAETAGRGKKEVSQATATPTAKRARGNKRLADEEITELLEEGPEEEITKESETKTVGNKRARGGKSNDDENGDVPTKKRGKKNAKEEEEPELQKEAETAAPSMKRAPKKLTDKRSEESTTAAVPEKKPARGRKRPAAGNDENLESAMEGNEVDGSTTSKAKKKPTTEMTDIYDKSLFPSPADKPFNLKISSWNVAGLRAWLKKSGLQFVDAEEPDVFCLQETKCANDQLPEEMIRIPGYHPYWLCMPGGYAGVAIYSKTMPINVEYGIGNAEFDDVGRMITAEYEKFYLINVYVPNSGRKLVNLEPRMRWEKLFQSYVHKLDALKPVIICGDMNVSHLEIDLANPKSNTRNAGFTKEERDKMTELLSLGFVDTFRHLYPQRTGAYTFWTYMANARARNVGWRLDYCIVSERFVSRVVDNVIRGHCPGSDHCPITVFLNV